MTRPSPSGAAPRRWRPSPLWFGAALACGDSDRPPPLGSAQAIPGCEDFAYRPCDILTETCQRELFALVACVYQDPVAGGPPVVRQLDEANAIALIEAASAGSPMLEGMAAMSAMAADAAAFRSEVRGLELLGLLAPGLIEEPGDVIEQNVSSLIAYYLVPTREIVVIDRGDPVDDLDANTVLAHEFVHALQDVRYDLSTFGAAQALDSDAILAQSSLIEGEASLYQYLLDFAYRGADIDQIGYRGFFLDLMRFGLELSANAGSPALTAESIFPYTFGTVYAGSRWLAGGRGAVDALYGAPPRSSWEILRGEPYSSRSVSAFEAAPAPLEGYTVVADDVAGAWVSVAMLAGLSANDAALETLPGLAGRWQGDRFWVYATGEAPPTVAALWAIDWEDADAAARFSELAASFAPAGAVLRLDTAGASTRIVAVEREGDLEAWRARLAELSGAP